MNAYAATQAAVDYHSDRVKRRLDDRDAAEAAREQRIVAHVDLMAGHAHDDPAYCTRLVDDAEIALRDLRVRLHGESMTWQRAVLDVLHMGARRDDPEAIAVACEALRTELREAIRSDAGVYGIAATAVALGEDEL